MRFDTNPHPFYCGIDLHARPLDVCILSQDGAGVLHRHRQASPDALLTAIAPYRDQMVRAVAWILPWYGRAALGAQEGGPCVLGHALSRTASHGGKAKNDQSDSQKIAGRRRGGLLSRRPLARPRRGGRPGTASDAAGL